MGIGRQLQGIGTFQDIPGFIARVCSGGVPMVHASADWTANREYVAPALAFRVPGGGAIWLLGRIMLGGLFLMSGLGKLMAPDGFAASLANGGIPESLAPLLAGLGAGLETLGGLCIVLGFATAWAS